MTDRISNHGEISRLSTRSSGVSTDAKTTDVAYGLGTRTLSDGRIDAQVRHHRHNTISGYSAVALTDNHIQPATKTLEQHFETTKGRKPDTLERVHLQEKATKQAYKNELPKRVARGYYYPNIMAHEMIEELGVSTKIPKIRSTADAKNAIRDELWALKAAAKINRRQYETIKEDVFAAMALYIKAYRQETDTEKEIANKAFIICRDMARISAYQELHDKAAFTGSDHGSKHIHNNIRNALDIIEDLQLLGETGLTEKDKFLIFFVHVYHDTGYSTGTASRNFDAMKDHPLVGAKMLEENKELFVNLLDEESYKAAHKSVLYHAIMYPNLDPCEMKDGVHYGWVRAITSISDACAVTYDRKTQEFWEQPRAVIQLARLKMYLTMNPDMFKPLMNPTKFLKEHASAEAELEDVRHDLATNPTDETLLEKQAKLEANIEAMSVFLSVKNNLMHLVDETSLPKEKKEAFRGAITNQLNSMSAKITLGQYGAVMHRLGAELNTLPDGPKYRAVAQLSPSIVYGVLNDLFGHDQARKAFDKLAEEFGLNTDRLYDDVEAVAENLRKHGTSENRSPEGNAYGRFEIIGKWDTEVSHAIWDITGETRIDLKPLQRSLETVYNQSLRIEIGAVAKHLNQYAEGKASVEQVQRAMGSLVAKVNEETSEENMRFLTDNQLADVLLPFEAANIEFEVATTAFTSALTSLPKEIQEAGATYVATLNALHTKDKLHDTAKRSKARDSFEAAIAATSTDPSEPLDTLESALKNTGNKLHTRRAALKQYVRDLQSKLRTPMEAEFVATGKTEALLERQNKEDLNNKVQRLTGGMDTVSQELIAQIDVAVKALTRKIDIAAQEVVEAVNRAVDSLDL